MICQRRFVPAPNHLSAETAAPKSRGPLDGIKLRLFRVEAYDQAVNTPRSNAYPIIYSLLDSELQIYYM